MGHYTIQAVQTGILSYSSLYIAGKTEKLNSLDQDKDRVSLACTKAPAKQVIQDSLLQLERMSSVAMCSFLFFLLKRMDLEETVARNKLQAFIYQMFAHCLLFIGHMFNKYFLSISHVLGIWHLPRLPYVPGTALASVTLLCS